MAQSEIEACQVNASLRQFHISIDIRQKLPRQFLAKDSFPL